MGDDRQHVGVPSVVSPSIGGVKVQRHRLELEAAKLNALAARCGKRLTRWMRAIENLEQPLRRVVGRDEFGQDIEELILDADKKQVMVPVLPDREFREVWAIYQRTVKDLLVEQRERAKLTPKNGAPVVDDETFNAQMRELARATVLELPQGELDELLTMRKALDVRVPVEKGKDDGKDV